MIFEIWMDMFFGMIWMISLDNYRYDMDKQFLISQHFTIYFGTEKGRTLSRMASQSLEPCRRRKCFLAAPAEWFEEILEMD